MRTIELSPLSFSTACREQLKGWQRTTFKREDEKLNSVAVQCNTGLKWLDDIQYPLDWNGPTHRIFTKFRDEDLDGPIIDHLERVARRQPDHIAVTDSDTSLTFAELWDGLS